MSADKVAFKPKISVFSSPILSISMLSFKGDDISGIACTLDVTTGMFSASKGRYQFFHTPLTSNGIPVGWIFVGGLAPSTLTDTGKGLEFTL